MKSFTEKIAKEIRQELIKMHQRGPHVGSALSVVDILVALYFKVMHISSFKDQNRDRFILSKGHAVSALYATLAKRGFFNKAFLKKYILKDSVLYGHPVRRTVPGIEASTGALGHGLSIGVGIALAAKHDNKKFKIYILMGDGECQEGSVWEGAIQASRLKLDNIIVIIDANNLQGYDIVGNIHPISLFRKEWRAFGWGVEEVNGHNIKEVTKVLKDAPFINGKPSLVIAHTIKCKGVATMENQLCSHYFSIPKDKVDEFIKDLEN